jgi:dTDP-4-dehydrorhamnose reductase
MPRAFFYATFRKSGCRVIDPERSNERMADILLISPDGMLGRAFQELFETRKLAFESVAYPAFDVCNPRHVEKALHQGIRRVINCAAFTDVDGAETREAEADAVNAEAVKNLAERCLANHSVLVHFSTDYVFDGLADTPYRIDQPRNPQNAYGRSKAKGEMALVDSGCEHVLIRTSWLYAPWGKNFVDTIARFGHERPVIRVVDDQHGRPTSAQYLAARSFALLERNARGTYHVTDGEACTWFEFAQAIVAATGGSARVEPCTGAEFPRPARRPSYSVLDLSSTEALLGPSRDWRSNLNDVVRARAAIAERAAEPKNGS